MQQTEEESQLCNAHRKLKLTEFLDNPTKKRKEKKKRKKKKDKNETKRNKTKQNQIKTNSLYFVND